MNYTLPIFVIDIMNMFDDISMLVTLLLYTLMISDLLLGYCDFYRPKSNVFRIPLLGVMHDVNSLLHMLLNYNYDAG